MTRQLASIQKISALTPIEGADRIVTASILGWKCVVKKGDFSCGDLVVYFEIDSFLPIRQEYEFLRESSYKKFEDGREGFRIKTRRFKKQISQGLVLKPAECGNLFDGATLEENADVTDILGIVKYEPPIPSILRGKIIGRFPDFIPKTDETRVQLLQNVINRHVGLPCYVTEKIDGTSTTYYLKDEKFGICSRNYEVSPDDSTAYILVAQKLKIEELLRTMGKNLAIQGEIYGPNIGGNRLQQTELHYAVFQIFDIDACRYLNLDEFESLAAQLGLEVVPMIDKKFPLTNDIAYLVNFAQGNSHITITRKREGIVIRPLVETLDLGMSMTSGMPASSRLTFKVVNPEYLLEKEDE